MSRLEDECIFAIVRNRSGIDSGEIDYHLKMDRFERMSIYCLKNALQTIEVLKTRCLNRIVELERDGE